MWVSGFFLFLVDVSFLFLYLSLEFELHFLTMPLPVHIDIKESRLIRTAVYFTSNITSCVDRTCLYVCVCVCSHPLPPSPSLLLLIDAVWMCKAQWVNFISPEGRPGISDVSPLSRISGLSVWSHVSSSLEMSIIVGGHVQHMLPCGTGISRYALIKYFLICDCFLSILFYNLFNLVLKRRTETVNGTSIS